MSAVVDVTSPAEFDEIVRTSRIVVADFHADWCGPCKLIAPFFEKLSSHLSIPNHVTFIRVNINTLKSIASAHSITVMPTFIVFKNSNVVERITGADPSKVQSVVQQIIDESRNTIRTHLSSNGPSPSSVGDWHLTDIPKGFYDVTDEVDLNGLDLLNADNEFGSARVLFDTSKPTGLGPIESSTKAKDWVESDTDEQLMLYIPFQSTLKTHTLQITSLPPSSASGKDEVPMRPMTIQIYPNQAQILGFEEADSFMATQTITLNESDWDSTGTVYVPLRFVKFQNVTSLVLFIVNGIGSGERTRIDRIRIIGECGEKRELGKLEKIEDQ